MEKNESSAYWALLALSLAFSILALVTLLPRAAAVKPNVLGYRSVCSFAPAATALCGVLAGITCTLRNRLFSRRASAMRYRPLIVPAGVGLILLALAVVFGIRFAAAQSRFGTIISRTAPAAGARAFRDESGVRLSWRVKYRPPWKSPCSRGGSHPCAWCPGKTSTRPWRTQCFRGSARRARPPSMQSAAPLHPATCC